ncbi:MAG: hypothetical protein FD187_3151, partial [bacterium]
RTQKNRRIHDAQLLRGEHGDTQNTQKSEERILRNTKKKVHLSAQRRKRRRRRDTNKRQRRRTRREAEETTNHLKRVETHKGAGRPCGRRSPEEETDADRPSKAAGRKHIKEQQKRTGRARPPEDTHYVYAAGRASPPSTSRPKADRVGSRWEWRCNSTDAGEDETRLHT